jgi:hypothetical protein
MRKHLLFALAALFCSLLCADSLVPASTSLSRQDSEAVETFSHSLVNYRGVQFRYDQKTVGEVRARTIDESLASSENAAPPDTIYPRHFAFELVNVSGAPSKSFIKADLRVYPVDAYQQAFAADPKTAKDVSQTIMRLKTLLRSRNPSFRGEMPMVPLLSGYLAFRSHTRVLRFNSGSGFVFVTQGQQDEMPINNQNLSYEFQGLTDDGRYLVTAEFPVAAPFLEYNRDKAHYGGKVHECDCFEGPRYQRFQREYRAYVRELKGRIESLPAQKFEPSLDVYDRLLQSIEIGGVSTIAQ